MILISGLGNPGMQFEGTRHNVGFDIVDSIHESYNFPDYKIKFNGLVTKKIISKKTVVLFKPQNFMNLSGEPIRKVSKFYKIDFKKNLYIFHDDLDTEFSKFKVKENGGHGGHNGIKNIINHIGNDFHRLKFGIKNKLLAEKIIEPSDFVLSKFTVGEKKLIIIFKKNISNNLNHLLNKNFSLFVNNLSI